MKTLFALALTSFALQLSWAAPVDAAATAAPTVQAQHGRDNGVWRHYERQQRAQIQKLLQAYETGLNSGDVNGIVKLYTDDGVLLSPNAPSAVGINAVRGAYVGTFQAIGLNIRFEVAELSFVAPDWAILRTNSTGTIKIVANGAQVPEGNQELFVLRKADGEWKIARYAFSTFLPAAQ